MFALRCANAFSRLRIAQPVACFTPPSLLLRQPFSSQFATLSAPLPVEPSVPEARIHSPISSSSESKPKLMTRTNNAKNSVRSKSNSSSSSSSISPEDPETRKSLREFHSLRVIGPLVRSAVAQGWKEPTDIQRQVVPIALRSHNIVATAKTGTGKTAAYLLPMLNFIHLHRLEHAKQFEDANYEDSDAPQPPYVLIIAPTKELASQIEQHAMQLAEHAFVQPEQKPLKTAVLVGNVSRDRQEALFSSSSKHPVDMIIATPGRLLELLRSEDSILPSLLTNIRHLVVDECDRMLSMGFFADLREIYTYLPQPQKTSSSSSKGQRRSSNGFSEDEYYSSIKNNNTLIVESPRSPVFPSASLPEPASTSPPPPPPPPPQPMPKKHKHPMQVLFFSATFPESLNEITTRFASRHVRIMSNAKLQVSDTVTQFSYSVTNRKKEALLIYLLKLTEQKQKKQEQEDEVQQEFTTLKGKKVLVFVRTSQRADRLVEALNKHGISAQSLHVDKSPASRRAELQRFVSFNSNSHSNSHSNSGDSKDVTYQVMVTTDVLSRGIDIPDLDYVVNYDLPTTANAPEDYIHRVGRTARMGRAGTAISFVGRLPQLLTLGGQKVEINEEHTMGSIEKVIGCPIEERQVPGKWKDEETEELEMEKEEIEDRSREMASDILKQHLMKEARILAHKQRMREQRNVSRQRKERGEEGQFEERDEEDGLDDDAEMSAYKKSSSSQKQQQSPSSFSFEEESNDELDALRRKVSDKYGLNRLRIDEAPRLRDFREGRYEDVIRKFQEKTARKRGVHLPPTTRPNIRKHVGADMIRQLAEHEQQEFRLRQLNKQNQGKKNSERHYEDEVF